MRNRWSDDDARGREGADLVAYASRLLGAEESLVVWGGGNSSIKQMEIDYRGREVRVLRVKGSGSDMKSLQPDQITGLRMDDIEAVFERKSMSDQAMVDYLACAKLDPAAPRGSIETLLHGFIPFDHVYHTHADVIAAVTDVPKSEKIIREIYGKTVAWIPYIRPGFELSKRVGSAVRKNPDLEGIILDKHGIITYGESAEGAYARMIGLVSRAEEFLAQRRDRVAAALGGAHHDPVAVPDRQIAAGRLAPIIRGALGSSRRQLLAYDDSPEALRFSCWSKVGDISQLGPATPDHLLYTKQRALVLEIAGRDVDDALVEEIRRSITGYAAEYEKYFERYRSSEDLVMLDPFPRTVIVPGIGIFQSGQDVRATIVTRDIYHRSIAAMEAASSISRFEPIGVQDICDFEYWPLENYKLSLLPPEKELSRRVALVTGAGSGIGRAIAAALTEAGAAVGIADIDADAARSVADQLNQIAGFPQALAIPMDVRDESSVRAGFGALARAYGGVDIVVANAGIARSAPIVETTLDDWQATMGVNADGYFLTLREALRMMKPQALGGSIILVASKNVTAPGKDFAAYSASKAAQAQLARIAAMEAGADGIRVNVVNPDAVFGDSQLWSDEIRQRRAEAHGVAPDQLEDFYAARNILRQPVTAEDVARAVVFLASDRSSKTTGTLLPVDAGIAAAFPR